MGKYSRVFAGVNTPHRVPSKGPRGTGERSGNRPGSAARGEDARMATGRTQIVAAAENSSASGHGRLYRMPRFMSVLVLSCALSVSAPALVSADARSDYLVRLMTTSDQFRVRAQAALALARAGTDDPAVAQALVGVLGDEHPAVRAAAVSSLEARAELSALDRIRTLSTRDTDASVKAAARRAATSLERVARSNGGTRSGSAPPPTPAVAAAAQPTPSGSARFYVGVSTPATSTSLSPASLSAARSFIVSNVTQIPGVRVAPADESHADARRVMQQGGLVGYFLDVSVTSLEERPGGALRAAVTVIVNTYPGRDMRSILQGAATVSGGGIDDSVRQQAVEAALTGALRRLPQALEASAATARAP